MRAMGSSSATRIRVNLFRLGYPLRERNDRLDTPLINQLEFALQILADQAPHDLQAQTALTSEIEIDRQAPTVVLDFDVQTVALLGKSDHDTTPGQAGEGVLDGVLDQLVDDQRA